MKERRPGGTMPDVNKGRFGPRLQKKLTAARQAHTRRRVNNRGSLDAFANNTRFRRTVKDFRTKNVRTIRSAARRPLVVDGDARHARLRRAAAPERYSERSPKGFRRGRASAPAGDAGLSARGRGEVRGGAKALARERRPRERDCRAGLARSHASITAPAREGD